MKTISFLFTILLFTTSCKKSFVPIDYGKDNCAHCRMTIVDDRYAAEFVNEKGKAFKFDDIQCMLQFMNENTITENNLYFVEDYFKTTTGMIDAQNAIFLHHDFFNSPMNGDIAAFASETELKSLKDSLNASIMKWENLQ